jgi:hypothetical protein
MITSSFPERDDSMWMSCPKSRGENASVYEEGITSGATGQG